MPRGDRGVFLTNDFAVCGQINRQNQLDLHHAINIADHTYKKNLYHESYKNNIIIKLLLNFKLPIIFYSLFNIKK
jgi:hypothetical protein